MLALLVWSVTGIALWHFAVLVPDRFWGGIIGALLAAVIGAVVMGYGLPSPGLPPANPPGLLQGLLALPGAVAGLGLSYWYGARRCAQDLPAERSPSGGGEAHTGRGDV